MSEEKVERLRMDAYYYGFVETGIREIDEILSAVACAGKGYHHTESWAEPISYRTDGKSYQDLIQEAAQRAADAWNRRSTPADTTTREHDCKRLAEVDPSHPYGPCAATPAPAETEEERARRAPDEFDILPRDEETPMLLAAWEKTQSGDFVDFANCYRVALNDARDRIAAARAKGGK